MQFAGVAILAAALAAGCGGAAAPAATPSAQASLPITRGDYPGFGHAPDFSWIAGRLVRSAGGSVCDYIVFSTRRGEPWGGRIALQSGGMASKFPAGDMVVVSGKLDVRTPTACGQITYAVSSIEEH